MSLDVIVSTRVIDFCVCVDTLFSNGAWETTMFLEVNLHPLKE